MLAKMEDYIPLTPQQLKWDALGIAKCQYQSSKKRKVIYVTQANMSNTFI